MACDLDVLEIRVDPEVPAAGKRLEAIGFPDRSHVIFDITKGEVAQLDTRLQPGHWNLVAAQPGAVDTAKRLLTG